MNALLKYTLMVLAGGTCLLSSTPIYGAGLRAKGDPKSGSGLNISRDLEAGRVIVSWSGKGVLKQASRLNGRYKPVHKSAGGKTAYVVEPVEEQAMYRLDSAGSPVISVNVVGYVNLQLPPGLSLIANPLFYTNNSLGLWLPVAPDGAQVFKYTAGGGFEVSTFDAGAAAWSNPDLQIPIGTGFYFSNPSSETFAYTFVGEVLQGTLLNPLSAGVSTEGALVPQAGSINSVHMIPGEHGDQLRLLNNVGAGATEQISTYDGALQQWVPDLTLGVGQGLWIEKQNPQVWVRVFFAY